MSGRGPYGSNINLPSLDSLFSTEAQRQEAKLEKVQQLSIDQLFPFPDHPFQVRDDEEMDNVKVQIANAKEEVEKPFAQEEELKTKQARLEELNVLLRLDKRENEIVDGERDEDGPPQITQRGVVDMER